MDQDELDDQAREELEEDLIEVGEQLGFDSRVSATSTKTDAIYEDAQGHQHLFNFAPVGTDAVLPS